MSSTQITPDDFRDTTTTDPAPASSFFERIIFERIVAALRRPPSARTHLLFVCGAALIAVACFYTGVVPTRQYASDLTSPADCGWRILQGLRPHVDFATGMGSFVFMMWAAALKLGAGTLTGFGYIDAIVALAAGIWGYVVLTRRVGGILAVVGALMIVLLGVAPCAPGESFRLSTLAMHYNRWGFAILAVLIAESLPLLGGYRERSFASGLASGILVGILLFLKPNFGGAALAVAAASLLWNGRWERRRFLGLLAGTSAAVLPFLFFIHFQVGRLVADIRMAADARSGAVSKLFAAEVVINALPALLIVVALAILSQWAAPAEIRRGWQGYLLQFRGVLLACGVFCLGCLLLLTNSQLDRLPLNEILVLLFLDSILRGRLRLEPRHGVALVLVAAGAVLGWVGSDFLAVMNGVRLAYSVPKHASDPLIHRANVGGFAPLWMLDDYDQDTPSANHGLFVAEYLTDGAALLRRAMKPGEIVAAFDTYNPLPYAVGARPARGGMAFARYKYHFSDRSHPAPETYFGDADIVMYPKTPDAPAPDFAGLLKYYGAELDRQFVPVAESERWKLYRRRAH